MRQPGYPPKWRAVLSEGGLVMSGAAGDPIDRADPSLAIPDDAVGLPSACGFSDYDDLAVDDIPPMRAASSRTASGEVCAALRRLPGSATAFAGSWVGWIASLASHACDNSVSRVTDNIAESSGCDGSDP